MFICFMKKKKKKHINMGHLIYCTEPTNLEANTNSMAGNRSWKFPPPKKKKKFVGV